MWAIDNIGEVLIWSGLCVIFPTISYLFYSLTEIHFIIWLIASASISAVITAFLSPIILISLALSEGVLNLFHRKM